MRQVVRDGHVLGLFVEGTRQRSGVPGKVKPGAAMVAIQEDVPVVPAAIHGTQRWRLGNSQPGVDRLGRADALRRAAEEREGLPRGDGRDRAPRSAGCGSSSSTCTRSAARRRRPVRERVAVSTSRVDRAQLLGTRRDRRLSERRQVDARQPADRDARGGRPRDAGRHARPQGARLRVGRQAVPARSTRAASTSPTDAAITRSIADQARAAVAGGRPRPLRRRRAERASRPATRSSPRSCAARTSRCSCSRTRSTTRAATSTRSSSTGSGSATRSRSRRCTATAPATCSTTIVERLAGLGADARRGRRGGDPRRDPRPAERRQVEPPERAARRGARDRLGDAGHDARLDRHRARARRARRSCSSTRPASGASAASARGSSTTRSCARSRRPSAPTSRSSSSTRARASSTRTSPSPTWRARPSCSTLVVLSKWDVTTIDDRGRAPAAEPTAAPAAADRRRVGEDRPRDQPPARPGREAVRQAHRAHPDRPS